VKEVRATAPTPSDKLDFEVTWPEINRTPSDSYR